MARNCAKRYGVRRLAAAFRQASLLAARGLRAFKVKMGASKLAEPKRLPHSTVAPLSEGDGLRCYFPALAVTVLAGLATGCSGSSLDASKRRTLASSLRICDFSC